MSPNAQILVAVITTLGSVLSSYFARSASRHARDVYKIVICTHPGEEDTPPESRDAMRRKWGNWR
jgi:hypothetical protein